MKKILLGVFLCMVFSAASAQIDADSSAVGIAPDGNGLNLGAPTAPFGKKSPKESPLFQDSDYNGLTYQVHIIGEVGQPGTYRLRASTRLSEAVEKGGGILERGSERRIELRRNKGVQKVDLLSYKLFGNLNANPYLLENDVIFVPLKEKIVEVEGPVKRPGVYELKDEKTLKDLLQLTGGFTVGLSDKRPLKVVRFRNGSKEVMDVENTDAAQERFMVENSDIVIVPHLFTEKKEFDYNFPKLPGDSAMYYPSYDDRVFVIGAVGKPGAHPFNPFYGVGQYLTLSGGTTKLAKVREIQVLNSEGKTKKIKNSNVSVNPGDTIIVPEKYMPPESLVTLILGLATSALGITTTILTLK